VNFTHTVFGSVANDDLKIIIFVQSTHNVNDVLECLAIDPECIPHFGFGYRKIGGWGGLCPHCNQRFKSDLVIPYTLDSGKY